MKLLIAAIGKMKDGSPEALLMREYSKRLPWKLTVREIEPKPTDDATRKAKEAELLLAACDGYDIIIALDERGRDLPSRELAKHISQWQGQGMSSIAVIIGGADGLDESVRRKATLLLAFGRATWPHMLVRAMLTEQLYRAAMILENHPYHRD